MVIFHGHAGKTASVANAPARGMRHAVAVLATVALAMLGGCATFANQTPEQQVQARAEAFWKARTSANTKAAYAFLTPAYRSLNSEQDYAQKAGAGAALQGAQVVKVSCEAEKCLAQIGLTGKPMVPGLNLPTLTNYFDDTWVLEEGQWWRYQAP